MLTPAAPAAQFKRASDQSLIIYFGERISPEAHRHIRALLQLLKLKPVAGIRNLHPAYCSLLVQFDPLRLQHQELQATLESYLGSMESVTLPEPREVEIPVCYGGEFGPDLEEVSAAHKIAPEETVQLHSSVTYTVYFLGFVPGFAYLGPLPDALISPRMETPRRKVPAGGVGIAGSQTGIYPFSTPGGWRVLGRTPLTMFRPDREELSLLTMGDRVRFVAISRERFAALEGK